MIRGLLDTLRAGCAVVVFFLVVGGGLLIIELIRVLGGGR